MPNNIHHARVTPIDEEVTSWFPASSVRLGLEYRFITPESVQRARDRNPGMDLQLDAQEGWSLHVLGEDDGHEYLRLDCFPKDPHYHYILNDGNTEQQTHKVFNFDAVTLGDMWPWVKDRLRTSLPQMLQEAQGDKLLATLDMSVVDQALKAVDERIDTIRVNNAEQAKALA